MKCHYYPETDSLYIDLTEKPSSISQEIAPGVVIDLDEHGAIVGIDIDRASQQINLAQCSSNLPWQSDPVSS